MKVLLALSTILLFLLCSAVSQRRITVSAQPDKTQHPGPRTASCLIYDEQRRQALLLGGYLWSSPRDQLELTEVWAWDGKQWARIPGSGLMARTLSGAVYDLRRKRIVSFWGVGSHKEQRWEWDGKSWRQLADTRADDRIHPAMVYDAGRGKIVLILSIAVFAQTPAPDAATWVADLASRYNVAPNITYLVANNYEAKLDVYTPRNASATAPAPTVIYIHGGGWTGGDKNVGMLRLLPYLEMGWAAVNVNYRLTLAPAARRRQSPESIADDPRRRSRQIQTRRVHQNLRDDPRVFEEAWNCKMAKGETHATYHSITHRHSLCRLRANHFR